MILKIIVVVFLAISFITMTIKNAVFFVDSHWGWLIASTLYGLIWRILCIIALCY